MNNSFSDYTFRVILIGVTSIRENKIALNKKINKITEIVEKMFLQPLEVYAEERFIIIEYKVKQITFANFQKLIVEAENHVDWLWQECEKLFPKNYTRKNCQCLIFSTNMCYQEQLRRDEQVSRAFNAFFGNKEIEA